MTSYELYLGLYRAAVKGHVSKVGHIYINPTFWYVNDQYFPDVWADHLQRNGLAHVDEQALYKALQPYKEPPINYSKVLCFLVLALYAISFAVALYGVIGG